jgi:hypothetical protein
MLSRIPKVLLLVALLAVFVASSASLFGGANACGCYRFVGDRIFKAPGGCHFNQTTLQCVSTSCRGFCG